MKQHYLTLLVGSIISFGSIAQTTITADNMPKIGDSYQFHKFDTTIIMSGDAGENANWNFSSLPSHETWEIKVEDASTNQYASNFPNADFVITNNYFGSRGLGEIDKNYHFFSTSNDQLIKLGRVDENGPLLWTNNFGDSEIQYQYPFKYQDTHNDSWNGGFNSLGLDIFWNGGVTKYTVDGHGTLTLNGQEISNVLRVKRERTYTSTLSNGMDWSSTIYEWYTPGIPFPLMTFLHRTVNGAGDVFEGYYIDASDLQTVGIHKSAELNHQLIVFPNPASNSITIQTRLDKPSNVLLLVHDVSGKLVRSYANTNQPAGNMKERMDLSELENGLYFITATIDDHSSIQKVNIIHNH